MPVAWLSGHVSFEIRHGRRDEHPCGRSKLPHIGSDAAKGAKTPHSILQRLLQRHEMKSQWLARARWLR
nr:hypothetical protein [Marinicella sp. W31]MDC2877581.1 hypothetical protein [Marinicella sp. W31]